MKIDRLDLSVLEPYWQRGRVWWSARSPREQVLLGVLSAFAVIALLLILVVNPLRDARGEALARIRSANLLEARLRSDGEALAGGSAFQAGSASAIVTNSTNAAGLKVQSIETQGEDTRVVLEDAPFDAVLKWISDIERNSDLRVRDVSIASKGAPGYVSATVVIGK